MRRPAPDELTPDGGFTLTELLVSIAVFSVVSAMVTAASVTGLQHQRQDQNRSDALAQLRTVIQRVDRDIRATYPLLSASATRIVLCEVQSSTHRIVTYAVSGTSLMEGHTTASTCGVAAPTASKTLVRDLTTSAVFSFAPITGYTAPSGSGVNATTCVMSGGTIDVGCVGTITVRVSAQPPYLATPIAMSDNGTDLRNAA